MKRKEFKCNYTRSRSVRMLGMVATHSALLQLDSAWKAASSPCSWWPGGCCCAVTCSSYPSTSLASTVNTAATSLAHRESC